MIRDPLWETIRLDPTAVRIIDTAEFQRLRYIRQLGLAPTKARNLRACLNGDFSRVSPKTAKQICETSGVAATRRPSEICSAS